MGENTSIRSCCKSSILKFYFISSSSRDARTVELVCLRLHDPRRGGVTSDTLCISRAVYSIFYQHDLSNTTTVESVEDMCFRLTYCILGNNAQGDKAHYVIYIHYWWRSQGDYFQSFSLSAAESDVLSSWITFSKVKFHQTSVPTQNIQEKNADKVM